MRSALEWTLIGVRSYILLDRYSGYADHFNTVGVIFALFWVALTALLLALIRPFLRLPTSTFALIYAALMVATVMPTMGFGGYFIPLLAGVFYYATPENNWRELLWDHIPDWAAPRDLEMIRNLFEGAPAGAPLPWDAWLGPSIFWGLFMVAFFLVSFALIALLHHQWASGERLVYMAYFLYATGLSLGWSLAFLLVALLVFLGTARLLVQTGLGRLRAPHSIPPLFTNIFGTAYFGDKGLTAMGLNMVWAADVQLFFMGTMAHAFKVCEEVKEKISARKLLFFLASALVISAITTIVVYIWLGYQHGMMHGFRWYYINSPLSKWGWVAKTVNNPHSPQHLTTLFTGIGAGLAGLLSFAQHRLAGWPLHPVGLAVALTNTVRGDWFGIFLAWLVKSILISYGGVILYRKVRPLFLGFIMGACVGVGGSSLVYSFYYF